MGKYLLLGLVLVVAVLVSLPRVHLLLLNPQVSDPIQPQKIHLTGVRLTGYKPDGSAESKMTGDRALMGLKSEDIDLFPARIEILKGGVVRAWMTARIGRRRVGSDGRARLEFEGNVLGQSDDGRQLVGQVIVYDLKDEKIYSSQPVTLLATDTKVVGDTLETHSNFEYGRLKGHVEISHYPAPRPGASPEAPLTASGDEADFDFKSGRHEIRGSARVNQGTMRQASGRVQFLEAERQLISTEKVDAVDGTLAIHCDLLTYGLDSRRSRAQGSPSIRQTQADSGDVQEMVADDILANGLQRTAEGKGHVRLTTWVKRGRALVQDAVITSDEAETDFTAGRSTFKGHVEIRSEKGVSKGSTAVYYKGSRKAYVSGDAEAWEQGQKGEKLRHVRSEQLLYEAETGRSIALGSVEGFLGTGS